MKYLYSLVLLLFLFCFTFINPLPIYAQICGGSGTCVEHRITCSDPNCTDPDFCDCYEEDVVLGGTTCSTDLNGSCSAVCGVEAGVFGSGCGFSGPTPTSGPTCSVDNCFDRWASDGQGGVCEYYGQCEGPVCVQGNPKGTCPVPTATPAPTAAPTAGPTSTPTPTPSPTPSPSPTAAPTAAPTATPTPTSPPVCAGDTCGGFLCCPYGYACQYDPTAGYGSEYSCQSGGGGGPIVPPTCGEAPNPVVFIDSGTNNNRPDPGEGLDGAIYLNDDAYSTGSNGGFSHFPAGTYSIRVPKNNGTLENYYVYGIRATTRSAPLCSPSSSYSNYNGTSYIFADSTNIQYAIEVGNNPGSLTISGNVFNDTNSSNSKDGGETNASGVKVYLLTPGTISPFVVVDPPWGPPFSGPSTGRASIISSKTTTSNGNYSFTNLSAGGYQVLVIPPPGYYMPGTQNPKTANLGSTNIIRNFGLRIGTPVCPGGSISPDTSPINASSTTPVRLTGCASTPPVIGWLDPTCGANTKPNNPRSDYTAQASVPICQQPTCTVTVGVADDILFPLQGNMNFFTTTVTVRNSETVRGRVYRDILNNNCNTLSATAGVSVELWNAASSPNVRLGINNTNGSGLYTLTNNQPVCTNLNLNLPGEDIKAVRADGSSIWAPHSGSSYPLTLNSDPKVVDFCIKGASPWFQVTTGDVRFPNLSNLVPANNVAALGDSGGDFPGLYIGSNSYDLDGKRPSTDNWKVDDEYQYNSDFKRGKGGMAYDFYMARVKERGQTVTELATGTPNITNLPSGVYHLSKNVNGGNLTVSTSRVIDAGRHVVLLVEGDVAINNTIKTAPATGGGNLFILAAKGNITIGAGVGTAPDSTPLNGTTTQLDGFYSAQGDIIIPSAANCAAGTPISDLRLVIGGALIANAHQPFSDSGSGQIINSRTLCANDITYPTLKVITRPDFLTQMTDFYKNSYKEFREVNP